MTEINMKLFIVYSASFPPSTAIEVFPSQCDVGIMSYGMTLVEPELRRISFGRNVEVYLIRTFP
jgi:hypothetical protein